MSPTVLYDVRQEGPPVGGAVKGAAATALVGALLLAVVWQRREKGPRLFVLAFLVAGVGLFAWNAVRASRAHERAVSWASSGQASVVEGEVRDFSPAHDSRSGIETFRVGEVVFRIDGDATTTPGLQRPSDPSGPIRAGARVRVLYRGPSILRVEELSPPPTE